MPTVGVDDMSTYDDRPHITRRESFRNGESLGCANG